MSKGIIVAGFEGIKDDTSTLEDSKESAEKDGATCVIK